MLLWDYNDPSEYFCTIGLLGISLTTIYYGLKDQSQKPILLRLRSIPHLDKNFSFSNQIDLKISLTNVDQ